MLQASSLLAAEQMVHYSHGLQTLCKHWSGTVRTLESAVENDTCKLKKESSGLKITHSERNASEKPMPVHIGIVNYQQKQKALFCW